MILHAGRAIFIKGRITPQRERRMTTQIDSPLKTSADEPMTKRRRTVFLLGVDNTLSDNGQIACGLKEP
jgi:hypothetical protein